MRKNTEPETVFSQLYKCQKCKLMVSFKHIPNADPRKDAWQCTTPGCTFEYKSKFRILRKKGLNSKKKEEKIPLEKPQDLSFLEQISTV